MPLDPSIVTKQDPRFDVLIRNRNDRFPASPEEQATQIDVPGTVEALRKGLEKCLSEGKRPTVRSGGHCYEDFVVNNPGGVLFDVSQLSNPELAGPANGRYIIPANVQLGDLYTSLYKKYGVCLPAGTCYTVGAGGHISGGGYGLLARRDGLTVDYVSAVDILTVNAKGKVEMVHATKQSHPELLRACRGAGGQNYGVITAFYCDDLPKAPSQVASFGLNFPWSDMAEAKFVKLLTTYGKYWETRGKDQDTWGLFTILVCSHTNGGSIGMNGQFCNLDGTAKNMGVLYEFLDQFLECNPRPAVAVNPPERTLPAAIPNAPPCGPGSYRMNLRPWLDATVGRGGGGGGGMGGGPQRADYKCSHMKRNFTEDEARVYYKHLTRKMGNTDMRGSMVAIDSYGGKTNSAQMARETSNWQRNSILKLQYQNYWQKKEDDAVRLQWFRDFYTEVHSGARQDPKYAGTPFDGAHYEGCYINYPDVDMVEKPYWEQLYYGTGDLYPMLQKVKQKYDPNNVWHHKMSVRPSRA
ncbi:MAG: BBE domain-containing protein [Acidobacteria bacterium]|nr:BBE domain-containing protein [Acidobacteriota bacterium]